ncbi:hypothetical protein SEA_KABOCHA_102 [Gordonia phage Kabocha]|uniref:Uncharacterized protein n=1 Tax=Gordonia phage Chidiebere TaxID=2656530 RepID=A0A649VLR9_9CAUD|nr:hypothetical protein PQD14_gp101 [Gordonia phage Chidiebere]AZS07952.1 hypothetical protein PBI_GRAY_101 [Gordonia phage Gray]WAA19888.1 hypothetical protein SEA_KABOCHA_102 [Gordonia phage Kabocha]WAA20077.1 hypothetical protein SEA_HANEM_100 [Gordonia phage Hanem]WNM67120.1 hypothetical protein SEA_SCHOMBER_99 [Gordonia Phage Schomber]QGJ92989.1 hypothetical protein PBI_CHIDIEBERE_101 [Gordonia phage Chidiebere]
MSQTDDREHDPDVAVGNMPYQVGVDPVLIKCQACFSKPGEKCTQPTNDSQRTVNWFHLVREDNARDLERSRCNIDLGWHSTPHTCMKAVDWIG